MSFDEKQSTSNIAILVPGIDEEVVTLLMKKSKQTLKSFCNVDTITADMSDVLEDLIIYKYNTIDRLGIENEGLSSSSVSINQDIPLSIKTKLNKFKTKIKVF